MKTNNRHHVPSSVIGLLLVLAVVAVSASGAVRRNGKIAFTSNRDGNREIYLMNDDGTGQFRLTDSSFIDDKPVWSPDGKKIAFLSQTAANVFGIYIIDGNGNGRTFVTQVDYVPYSPWSGWDSWSMSWSPDSRQLAFSNGHPETSFIFIVNSDGTGRRALISGLLPSWSPYGNRILFIVPGQNGLRSVKVDGTDLQVLSPSLPPGYGVTRSALSWSPDGSKFAFAAFDGANVGIYTANPDGSGAEQFEERCVDLIPEGCSSALQPEWSPNGRTIAFTNGNGLQRGIYSKNIGAQEPVNLTNVGLNAHPDWQPLPKATVDFDDDGRSDIAVFRPSTASWYINRSTSGFAATVFGLPTDKITPADYDGDGKTDIAVFRDGTWWRMNSSDQTVVAVSFGIPGDIPVPADYDGNGRDELAVYRGGEWWARDPVSGDSTYLRFGLVGDKAVPADFDGDGRVDQAVYRNGEWHINRSTNGYTVLNFGLSTDRPLAGDFDGDLKSDLAVYRDGTWYLLQSSDGFTAIQWGISTDVPAPADYDGDGKTDAAVFRNGTWYLRQSTSGISIRQFGLPLDIPVSQID